MVGTPHEALHQVFREDTALVTRALRRLFNIDMPAPSKVSVLNIDVTEIKALERRADTLLWLEHSLAGKPANLPEKHIVIVESQARPKNEKLRNWPYYIAYLHEKYECPVTLLVVCSRKDTACWARRPIEVGLPGWPSLVVLPKVVGPDNVPAITDTGQAREDVMFALFAALTHRNDTQPNAILEGLADALGTLDPEEAAYFAEFTEAGLGDTPARKIWRDLMSSLTYHYPSELRLKGRAEGRAEGEARAVVLVLEGRGVDVSGSARERILACDDTETLERWLVRAATATTVEDLLAEEDTETSGPE